MLTDPTGWDPQLQALDQDRLVLFWTRLRLSARRQTRRAAMDQSPDSGQIMLETMLQVRACRLELERRAAQRQP